MEAIDRTGILPLTLCTTSVWGAIWTEKMRSDSAISCALLMS